MHPYKRSQRVAVLLREVVSQIIQQDLKAPEMDLVTVTEVGLSDDLRSALIYYTCLGAADTREGTRQVLTQSIPHIKRLIGQRMRLKYMPELQFRYDPTYETGQRIDSILEQLKNERESEP